MKESLVFVSGARTPFGKFGGSLKSVEPSELGASCSRAALERAGVSPSEVDHVVYGHVLYSVSASPYVARHVGLKTGVPEQVPALGINRLCGSGFEVVVDAFQQMLAGETRVALVGGVENLSLAPYVLSGARFGMRMGNSGVTDLLAETLTDQYVSTPIAITAETLAKKYSISRRECDEFAFASQEKTRKAAEKGFFRDEIAPISVELGKGKALELTQDEHPRPETTLESLSSLKPAFDREGVVTAGNASGIVDGAASLVVMTEGEAKKRNLQPLGRLVSSASVGCDPRVMGIGPVPAIRKALERAGKNLGEIDLIEVNEAFAPQTLAVAKELEIDLGILNVNGGAIAIGHPLAASGTRILLALLLELRRRKKSWGIGAACIGGGQGIALVVEAY